MKYIKSLIISAAVIVSAAGIQSCSNAPYQKTNAKNRLASVTQHAITDMSEIYAEIEDVTITNDFDNALAAVLSNQELDYNPIAATNEALREKITIFNLYRIAVHEYSKLISAESNIKSLAPFSNACSSITKKFSNSQDTVLVNIATSINSYTSSQRYNVDQVMKLLINSLDIIWQNDTKNWNDLLNESFTSYQDAIN
ncbi:MAG: hypothetical protein J5826_09945, partial [Bacteroidales bacterium]|nr:hypothetical protein [Bacteroidales bacterium]